jgi:NAD(P)-dependent dehydrogenase (short-subunit alcohol dehydrogenase family)
MSRSKKRADGAWLVTGAASGFGRTLAKMLGDRGEQLVLWDRNAAGLEETRAMIGARAHIEAIDVTDADAVRAAADRSRDTIGPIAHVFHSAGVLAVGSVEDVSPADYRRMIEVNYLGSVHVALALLPQLRGANGRATLTFVASVAGLRGFPELAGYSASKFAVVGFAQALADELARTNVRVKVLCPPPGDTPMVRNLEKLPPVYKLSPLFSAEDVAIAALREMDRPGLIALVDVRSKALWRIARVAPAIVDRVVRSAR